MKCPICGEEDKFYEIRLSVYEIFFNEILKIYGECEYSKFCDIIGFSLPYCGNCLNYLKYGDDGKLVKANFEDITDMVIEFLNNILLNIKISNKSKEEIKRIINKELVIKEL